MSKWYFTFGADENYPYPNGYVAVYAEDEKQAVETFRKHFPDRTPDTVNCAFWYSETQWEFIKSKFDGPAEVIRAISIKDSDLNSIASALIEVGKAWDKVQNLFDAVDEGSLNEFICEDYPFDKSFSEIDVHSWVNSVNLKITGYFLNK